MAIEIEDLESAFDRMTEKLIKALADGKISPSGSDMKKVSKMTVDEYKKHIQSLKKSSKSYESLGRRLEELDEAIESSTDESDRSVFKSKKRLVEEERLSAAKRESIIKFGKSLDQSAKVAVVGATKMAGSLITSSLDGGNAFAATGEMMNTVGSMIGGTGKVIADGLKQVGDSIPFLGALVTGAGLLIGAASAATEKIVRFGSDILIKELAKTVKGYADASTAGALFADGMSGLRKSARDAGMTTVMFTNTLKSSSAELAAAGLSVSGAAAQMGRVSQIMDAKGLKNKLMNLGFAYEDHGALIATVMADMSRVDPTKKLNEDQVAQQTAKYAENLRLISAITGEDAKKKMEEARAASNTLAFQQKLAKKTPEEQARITQAMSAMTAQQKQNFMDMINFGSVINKNGAIMEAQMPAMAAANQAMVASYYDGSMSLEKVAGINAANGEAMRKQALAAEGLATAGVALPGSLAETISKIMLDTMQMANKYTKDAVATATKDLESQGGTLDPLTGSVNKAQREMVNLGQKMEELTDGPMTRFADVTATMVESMGDAIDYIMSLIGESKPASAAAMAGAKTPGGMINAKAQQSRIDQDEFIQWKRQNDEENILNVPFYRENDKKEQMARFEEAKSAGWKPTEVVDPLKADLESKKAEYAARIREKRRARTMGEVKDGAAIQRKNGGVSDGPESGYKAILHGTEAVVPMPDGKTVPVTLNIPDNSGSSVINKTTEVMSTNNEMLKKQLDLMTQFVEKADQLVDAVNDQKAIQQSILQATY